MVADTMASIEKSSTHQTKQAKGFTEEQFQDIFVKLSDEGKDLSVKVVAALSTVSLSRGGASKKITCASVAHNVIKNRIEIKVPKIKLRADVKQVSSAQEYFIEGKEMVRVILLYISKINPKHKGPDTQFIKNYNSQSDSYCQPMGKNNLASLPSFAATKLGIANPEEFKGHSWRRSGARFVANSGASTSELKTAGQWKSEKAMYKYIDESERSRTKTAQVFANILTQPTPTLGCERLIPPSDTAAAFFAPQPPTYSFGTFAAVGASPQPVLAPPPHAYASTPASAVTHSPSGILWSVSPIFSPPTYQWDQ